MADVPDACPAVTVWRANMTTEEAHDAKDEAQQEAINILSTIGLDLQPPEKDGGSFQVLQLVDDTDFAEAILEEGETTVRFDNLEGSKGIVIYAADVNTTLEVTTPGKYGAVAAKRNKVDKQFPTSDDVANFKIGESFCGAGYFTDPLNDKDAHKTDAARLFLAPLGALAITLHFHPEQTQVCLGGERKFPEIIYYRVDGIFPTSFGASWQVYIAHTTQKHDSSSHPHAPTPRSLARRRSSTGKGRARRGRTRGIFTTARTRAF